MKPEGGSQRSAQRYDEEYRALQATLEEYLREQVDLLSSDAPAPVAAPAPEGWFRRWRADLYFAVTLVLIALLWWRPAFLTRPPTPGDRPTVTPARLPEEPPATAAAPPEASGALSQPPAGFQDPDAWWSDYASSHSTELAAWLTAVSQARGLQAEEVSPMQKQNFARWADTVRAGGELDPSLLASLRKGLFEYVYGCWIAGAEGAVGSWGKVDLLINAAEYETANLKRFLAEFGRDHWFENLDPQDKRVQTTVVLAWLEAHRN